MTQNKNFRMKRIESLLQSELSRLIQRELKDPRIGMLSITRIYVSKDLSVAKIYISPFKEEEYESTLEGLESASGYLHGRLLKSLDIRQIPELRFYIDTSIKYARYMEDKMKNILKDSEDDKEV